MIQKTNFWLVCGTGKLCKIGYSWCIHGRSKSVADLVHNSPRDSVAASGEDKPMFSLFVGLANCASLDTVGAFIA
jgi:hypothetical protein